MNRDLKWMKFFNYAKEYYNEHGNLNVPSDYEIKGLHSWINYQRKKNESNNPLTKEQIDLLNSINYVWNVKDNNWQYRYNLVKEYAKERGNCNVAQGYMVDDIDLGRWIALQRILYFKGKLSKDRIEKLEELKIKWNYLEESWNDNYQLAKEYYKEHGNLEVPNDYIVNGVRLRLWVYNQRNLLNNAKEVTDEVKRKIKLFNEIGMRWDNRDIWMEKYEIVKEYYDEFGTIDIPFATEYKDMFLGRWVHTQRRNKKKGKLSEKQISLLDDLGMKWDYIIDTWNDYYQLLEEYYQEHGNSDVPQYYEIDGVKLGQWVRMQRQAIKGIYLNRITDEQIFKLNELNFKWNIINEKKKNIYEIIKEYYQEHGNLDVSLSVIYKDFKLGHYLASKRYKYMKDGSISIPKEEIVMLNSMNFDWAPTTTKLLNSKITIDNKQNYNKALLTRMKHILEDLTVEDINNIDSINTQKEMEDIIVKRLFR